MESNLTHQDWDDVLNRANPVEFGWIGVDKENCIAYFSTFGQAYIPQRVMSSYSGYIKLAEFINSLAEISSSKLVTREKGWFHNWHFHSRRGIVGYDFLDVHRKESERFGRYDLITVPETLLKFDSLTGIEEYKEIIPHFSLRFNSDILFNDLRNAEF